MNRLHVTVGILAYQEADTIARTIRSLADQSVFDPRGSALPNCEWEVVVVPNGCRDATQARAEEALASAASARPALRWRVVPLERAGKSNAWNELVHAIAAPHTDVFVMMDADIEFGHPDTIRNCVRRLLDDDDAWAVVDLPLKDFHRKAHPTRLERMSMRVSARRIANEAPGISGQFYVVRAPRLRDVWMPMDLSVEDGFLYAMIVTNGFRQPPDASRVVRAADATHYFEGLTSLGAVVGHEVRILIGTVLNAYLCWDVLLFMTQRDGPGAGQLVRALNEQDPTWYRRMMNNQIAIRGPRPIRADRLWHRLRAWRRLPLMRRAVSLPSTIALSLFDALVQHRANRKLASGHGVGHW